MKKIILLFAVLPIFSNAQLTFRINDSIPVTQYGNALTDAWSGGINFPLWSKVDMNNDGYPDLFMFERSDNRVSIFMNNGASNPGAYHYVDSMKTHFPKLKGWAFLYDYNDDGIQDLFSVSKMNSGIIQYEGHYDAVNGYSFTCVDSVIQYSYGVNQHSNIPESSYLVPDFNDIDNDGDMDIIAHPQQCVGTFAYYRNNAVEHLHSLDSLNDYELVSNEWGNFVLRSGVSDYVKVDHYHDTTCPVQASPSPITWDPSETAKRDDTYSALMTLDLDGDGDKDALVGDSQALNVLAIYNQGDSSYADMDLPQDTTFPSYSVTSLIKSFSSCAYLDVDNDGVKDLLVGNSEFENRRGIQWYKNTQTNSFPHFVYQTDSLFQPRMIDAGEAIAAVLADVDNDGLTDLVIGNSRSTYNFNQEKTNLTFYKNTGTASQPSFELITEDFAGVRALALPGPLFPAFGDLDGDGDNDMLLGGYNGTLYYFNNNGGTITYTSANYMNIDVGNGSTPQLVDVNRDGVLDLIIGEQNGILNYYENTGSATVPFFSSTPTYSPFGNINARSPGYTDGYTSPFLFNDSGQYKLLVANMDGNVFLFDSIDNNLNGTFHLVDTLFNNFYGSKYGYTFSVGGADLNSDGRSDVVLGLYGGGAQIYYQVDPYLGVRNLSNTIPAFSVFPNPASDILNITLQNFNQKENYSLTIFDCIGRIVYQTKAVKDKMRVDASGFTQGIYLLQLQSEQGVVGVRSIKY